MFSSLLHFSTRQMSILLLNSFTLSRINYVSLSRWSPRPFPFQRISQRVFGRFPTFPSLYITQLIISPSTSIFFCAPTQGFTRAYKSRSPLLFFTFCRLVNFPIFLFLLFLFARGFPYIIDRVLPFSAYLLS